MSTTGVGPLLTINGPVPEAPPYSLTNIPGVVVDRDTGRWMNGVNIYGYPSDTPSLWAPCSEGTFTVKDEGSDPPIERFDPFAVYTPITCSTMGVGSTREFMDRAELVLEATLSMGVEAGLAQGVPGQLTNVNPYFGDSNLTILGGGAVGPVVGLSYLENAIGATGRRGVIHLTPAVATAVADNLCYHEIDGYEGMYPYTASGNQVIIGNGYIGTDPDLGGSPAAGQDYIFATGPVELRVGPLVFNDLAETIERSTNEVTFRAERHVLAEWDGFLQAGVLVDWSP